MKRVVVGIFSILMLTFFSTALDDSSMWHPAEDIEVVINGYSIDLQTAFDSGYFGGPDFPVEDYPSENIDVFHSASDFMVLLNGDIINLQEAVDVGSFTEDKNIVSTNFEFHDAYEIGFFYNNSVVSFQEAIDLGYMECRPKTCDDYGYTCGSHSDKCGGTINCGGCTNQACIDGACSGVCTPGQTGTKDCDYLDSTCRDYRDATKTCQSNGYWNNPSCTYVARNSGSYCSTDPNVGRNGICNSAGTCITTFSGKGCGDCPFGDYDSGCDDYCRIYDGIPDGPKCKDYGTFLGFCARSKGTKSWTITYP